MPVLFWATSAENLPRAYAILNLIVASLDLLIFFLTNSFFNPGAWFLFVLDAARLAIAIMLYFGVSRRNLDMCKGWCLGEIFLLVLLILTMIFGSFNVGYVIVAVIVLILRVYGLWIIYNFVKELQVENGEDNTIPSNFCPTPFRSIFQKNSQQGGPPPDNTQHV